MFRSSASSTCAAATLAVSTSIAFAAAPLTFRVDPTQTFQRMDGYGASMTESSAYLMNTALSASQRTTLVQALFDKNAGIGMSFLRQPMGSSDFALSPYSYDDVPAGQTDYGLSHFSIARDQQYVIPMLLQARALNPKLQVMGTPWSPPAWMKRGSTAQPMAEQVFGGHLKDSDAVYSAYADYFVKYAKAYAAAGVKVNFLSLQNEPWYETTTYPSMGMDPWEQARLVKLVAPRLRANGIDAKLLAWDHNWDSAVTYTNQLFADPVAAQYFDGVAVHGYGGDVSAQTAVHNAYPNKGILLTELSSSLSNTNFAADLMWDMQNLIVGGARNWGQSVVRWNVALDGSGFPRLPGGAPNCRGFVTINRSTGSVTFNQEYYSLGHASKFVEPGAVRVGSDSDRTVAFVNPDGSTAVIAYNPESSAQTVNLRWNGRAATYSLPAQSAATFAWSDRLGTNVQVWLTKGDKTQLLARQADLHFVAGAWSSTSGGSWFNEFNWSAGAATGIDAEAQFLGAITRPRTVYADSPVTLGTLRFSNANSYVLAGSSSRLTLEVSAGDALIDVQAGMHKINLPLMFASDTLIAVANGAGLLISDPVTIDTGVRVTQIGGGTVAYQSTVTVLAGATVTLSRGAEPFSAGALSLGPGATLELGESDLLLDDADFGSVRAMQLAGQITSAAERGGGATTLALCESGDAVVGKYAYLGDVNLDGVVSQIDLDVITAHLDTRPLPGVAWLSGDANLDGRVTPADYDVVVANFGMDMSSAVPEPSAICLMFGLIALRSRMRLTRPVPKL